jgi:hypothetical protein
VRSAREFRGEPAQCEYVEAENGVAAGEEVADGATLGASRRYYIKDVSRAGVSPGAERVEGASAVVGVEWAGEEETLRRLGHPWLAGRLNSSTTTGDYCSTRV